MAKTFGKIRPFVDLAIRDYPFTGPLNPPFRRIIFYPPKKPHHWAPGVPDDSAGLEKPVGFSSTKAIVIVGGDNGDNQSCNQQKPIQTKLPQCTFCWFFGENQILGQGGFSHPSYPLGMFPNGCSVQHSSAHCQGNIVLITHVPAMVMPTTWVV